MSPPFDNDRIINEGLSDQDVGVALPDQDQDFDANPESAEESAAEEEEEVEQEKPDTALSSVQQYLQDIGSVRLLSREREIELAKEVESATQQISAALTQGPGARHRVLILVRDDSAGKVARLKGFQPLYKQVETSVKPFDARELREAIDKPDDADDEGQSNVDPKPFLKQLSKLSRLMEERNRLRRELSRVRVSAHRRARLSQNAQVDDEKILSVIDGLRLSSDQLEKWIGQLTGLAQRVTSLEQQTRSHSRTKKTAGDPREGAPAGPAHIVRGSGSPTRAGGTRASR